MVAELQLRHLRGSLAGHTQRLALSDGQTITFGRNTTCDIRFHDPLDDLVSGLHARLRFLGGRLTLEDQKSTNGTFVDGVRCPAFEPVALGDGARVALARGGPELQILLPRLPGAPAAGAATRYAVAPPAGAPGLDRAPRRERGGLPRHTMWVATALVLLAGSGLAIAKLGWPRLRPAATAPASSRWHALEAIARSAVARVESTYRVAERGSQRSAWLASSGVLIGPEFVLAPSITAEPWQLRRGHKTRGDLAAITVQFPGFEAVPAQLFAVDDELELVLLRIPSHPTPAVPLAREDARLASEVAFVLHPWSSGWHVTTSGSRGRTPDLGPPALQLARVASTEPPFPEPPRRLELDRVTPVGAGGGAVLDARGQLLGLVRPRVHTVGDETSPLALRSPPGPVEVIPLANIRRFLARRGLPSSALAPAQPGGD